MENQHTIAGLVRKRAELVGKINHRLMAARGLSTANKHEMLQRIHSCLRPHRKRGRVRSAKTADRKQSVWELAG